MISAGTSSVISVFINVYRFTQDISHTHTRLFLSERFSNEHFSRPSHLSVNSTLLDFNPLCSPCFIKLSQTFKVLYSPQPTHAIPFESSNAVTESRRTSCASLYHNRSARNNTSKLSTRLIL